MPMVSGGNFNEAGTNAVLGFAGECSSVKHWFQRRWEQSTPGNWDLHECCNRRM